MTHIDTGITGAKRQSWRKSNPREVLKRLIEDTEGATKRERLKLFLSQIKDEEDPDVLDVIVEYWFDNHYRYILSGRREPKQPQAAANAPDFSSTKAGVKQTIAAVIERKANLVLLDLKLPNGKKLRHTTGAECSKFAPRLGVWLTKIAAKVKPTQQVGKVLSEIQVREFYDK